MSSDTMPDEDTLQLTPKSYQTEIMEQAKSENLIVCLPTGSGKTFIAIMLIKELSPTIRPSLQNGGKRTILLVKTIELGRQHYESLSDHLNLKIKNYCGSSKIKLDNVKRWNDEFENNHILIFIAQAFLNLLDHNLFSLDKVNLLVFDECQHGTGDDPYALIMKKHYNKCPRILGLTASISGQKLEPHQLQKAAKELQTLYDSRIETGANRIEIIQNSTSVKVEHSRCKHYSKTIEKQTKIVNMFKVIKSLSDELDKYLKTKKPKVEFENDSSKIPNPPNSIQIKCRTLDQLKSHLDNIYHIGYDLGLYGFSLGIISLRKYLQTTNALIKITDQSEKELYVKIIEKLDSLINDDLPNSNENHKILYSDKVIHLGEYITKNNDGQCIVFVERVYTAAFLCQVLRKILENSIQVKYLAGSKAYIDDISVSTKYQREVVKEFRENDINVLISTAIIEEGFDVPGCNLVIRFNKPQNFSSYMQSKGRARAKGGNASFVILTDILRDNDLAFEEFWNNNKEYDNYEDMEKMLKKHFKTDWDDDDDDSSSNEDLNSLTSYQLKNGVKIDAIRAVQIIYQYCAVLGNGQILAPRFLFYTNQYNTFRCVLSMPTNCPIRDDIICTNKNKRMAKQECCLKMVEMLHQKGELDERCLPIRPERCSETDDSSDDDESEKVSVEIIEKQISRFPQECDTSCWYLYRINISNNDDLGFIVPCQLPQLPGFNICGRDGQLRVEVIYLKSIDFKQYENQLEVFCRYIFEEVFDDMTTKSESMLRFDIEHSTFKLFLCLLNKSDNIDYQRMETICDRKNKLIRNPSDLNDKELYYPSHLSQKQLYTNVSDVSLLKRSGDKWEHKKVPDAISYADHFESKLSNIHIQRDLLMGTMKGFRRPRRNYLTDSILKKEKESNISSTEVHYYPIELLRYAPLNQTDIELIYKVPSVLVRIQQLYYIERLRKLLADNIQRYSLLDIDKIPTVNFDDCVASILSPIKSTALPLTSLNYDVLLRDKFVHQPSPSLLFQSITRRSANEKTDMENLEILGDCYLKLAMSMSLYHQYPLYNVGKLTSKKDKQVSNENLYRLATKMNLKNYLYANNVIYTGKEANWIPPGFTVNEENAERYNKQKAKRKAFADLMEALIGALLISTDYMTTIKFMKWLGLDAIPVNEHNQVMKTPTVLCPGLSDTMDDIASRIQNFYTEHAFAEIEKEINYVFQNKAYLITAFSHPSYINNRLTQPYERLEYLGDAVLDFLVIRCIFVEHYEKVKPGQVTSIRQDLSNNGRLAYILVSCNLHKNILHASPDLFGDIASYLRDETLFSEGQSKRDKLSKDIDQWADSTAPKALADVFEALVGAIFLDSGYSLLTVWKIIEPLLRPYIDRSIEHPNLSPIRLLHEHYGQTIEYTYLDGESNDRKGSFTCIVKLPDGKEFKGHGKNKRLAKYDACLKANSTF